MSKPTVLTVESEQRDAYSLAAALRDPSWSVVTAPDALEAIRLARETAPAVIVISSRALGGGGVAGLKRLRLSAHTATIPVIGVTGAGMRDAMTDAGALECMSDRASAPELREAVTRHMAKRPIVLHAPEEVVRDPARIAALARTGLLDSGADPSFDRLTRLASRLLSVPAMLVSLVDIDRQYFKSQVGLPEPWASERQTPLSHSFCQWVVSSGENLVINDARNHPTLRENQAVDQLDVIAYAGALLSAPEGEAIGTVCAVDRIARDWSADELATLEDIRDIAQSYVVFRSAMKPSTTMATAASRSLSAALRLLLRPNPRFTEADRADLVALIDDLSRFIPRAVT